MTRVAVIGLGTMGRNHARVLSELAGAELASVCDEDARAAQAASDQYEVPHYESWRKMLDAESLSAVVVAVPTRAHLEVAEGALDRGLHVLVEKPIATDLVEGRRLVECARRNDVVLAVGHVERFNPAVRELQRRIAAGDLGRIFQVQTRRQGPFPMRIRDVGVVIDLATHDLDIVRHIVGHEVSRLYAETEQRIHTEHEDMLNALLKFDNGVVGVIQVNWLTPTKIRELSVLGEGGLFHVNYLTKELTHYKNAHAGAALDSATELEGVSEGDIVRYPVSTAEPLQVELSSFLKAVADGGPAEVDGNDGLRALHLAQALVDSAQESRVFGRDELASLWAGGAEV